QQHALGAHPAALPYLQHQGIDDQEGVGAFQRPLVPLRPQRIELLAKIRYGRLRKARPTKLLGEATHLTGRNPIHDKFHQPQPQGLLAALIPCEQLGRKRPVSNPRHPQLQCANPCLEFLAPVPVPVPLTVLGPLIALGLQLLRDLGFEDLLDHGFDEPGQAVVALKQSSHHVLAYGSLGLGDRVSSSGWVGGYLDPVGGTVAYPVCSLATSLLHSLSDATTAASSGSSAGSCRCRWPCPSGSTPRCRPPWPTDT